MRTACFLEFQLVFLCKIKKIFIKISLLCTLNISPMTAYDSCTSHHLIVYRCLKYKETNFVQKQPKHLLLNAKISPHAVRNAQNDNALAGAAEAKFTTEHCFLSVFKARSLYSTQLTIQKSSGYHATAFKILF